MIGFTPRTRRILPLSLLFLSACDSGVPDMSQAVPPIEIPAEACQQVKSALEKVSEGGAFDYTDGGEATMEQAAWLQLEAAQKEQLEKLLALHKACGSKKPAREQEIVIRNETGMVVTQRIVETSPDLSGLVGDQ